MKPFVKMLIATLLFGVVHSLLASQAAKRAVEQRFGTRAAHGGYRVFFIVQSLATFGLLAAYALRLPGRVLYRVQGLPALVMRAGQAVGIGFAVYAASNVGIWRISGLAHLVSLVTGKAVPAPQIAQGPELGEDGRLTVGGPFLHSRHPLNWSPLPVFWLAPVLTTRRLAFNLAATLYLVLGSLHEEARLKAAYGQAYEDYCQSGIPFYWPALTKLGK